jgi:hypothetical protein
MRSCGDRYTHLRHQNKTYSSAHNYNGIPNRTENEERPTAENNRKRERDWKAVTKQYDDYFAKPYHSWKEERMNMRMDYYKAAFSRIYGIY